MKNLGKVQMGFWTNWEVKRRLKILALDTGLSMSQIIEEAVTVWLSIKEENMKKQASGEQGQAQEISQ